MVELHENVEQAVDEFLERRQRGDYAPISEYCEKYPAHETQIRQLLRTIEFADDPAGMLFLFQANWKAR